MDESDHREMAEALLDSKAMVVLSGYPHGDYDKWFKGWRCETIETLAEAQKVSTEAIWINPAAERAWKDAELPLFRNQPKEDR
jgi:DNA adenine methylase